MPIGGSATNPVAGNNAVRPEATITVGPEMPADAASEAAELPSTIELEAELTTPDALGNLPGLVEESSFGPLPRISDARSEERRVGKGCRSRGSRYDPRQT